MNKEEKCRNTQLGRIVIHKEDQEKRIYAEELEEYIILGWEKGPKLSHIKSSSISHKGKTFPNRDNSNYHVNSTSFKQGHIPWNKDKKGVQKSWSKDLTKDTDPRVAKLSAGTKKAWENADERRKAQGERAKSTLTGRKLNEEQLNHFIEASNETKRKNNSFNTSKKEEECYLYLCDKYGIHNVKRNYRDKERYPFRCDFYIPSKDLFIELNCHWTHGEKPFDPNDNDCCQLLTEWQEKAKQSRYFKTAIETWTVRDVNKLETAKRNNLNYLVVYNLEDIMND